MINLDHAATMPLRKQAKAALASYYNSLDSGNPSALHGLGRADRRAVDDARKRIAALLGTEPGEIYFTSGGTESDNWAVFGVAYAYGEPVHMITSSIEHHAVLHAFDELERRGFAVSRIQPGKDGYICPEAVEKEIRLETKLISIMTANNEIGTIEPILEISEIAAKHGVMFHTDAVQAVGAVPMNLKQLKVDLLSLSAHKFGGPRGMGILFIRRGCRITPFHFGGAQERGLRGGTENTAGILATAAALQETMEHCEEENKRIGFLRDLLMRDIIKRVPDVRINGTLEDRLPNNLHLSFAGVDQDALLVNLDMEGLAASAGSACTSGSGSRSHVMTAIGCSGRNEADLRLTLGPDNTEEEIIAAAEIIAKAVCRLRNT